MCHARRNFWCGPDNDTLYGGAGADTLLGEGGEDWLHSEGDGAVDSLRGDAGSDHATMDSFDTLLDAVEEVFMLLI